MEILEKRQVDACEDWKAFGERLSGTALPDFDIKKYQEEYVKADKENKDGTSLGRFFLAAMEQKSLVTNRIFMSRNLLAGFSVDYKKRGFRGIKDYRSLVETRMRGDEE